MVFTRYCIMNCPGLNLALASLPNGVMGLDLSDFRNGFFQKLSMMWASTLLHYF